MAMTTAAATTTKKDIYSPPLVPDQLHPWLLIHHGAENEQQIFYSVSNGSCYKSEIPELRNKFIHACCNEWLVTQDLIKSDECHLFNLVTKERVQLPQLVGAEFVHYASCVLSAPPSDRNCRILFIDNTFSSIKICRVGEDDQIFHDHDMGEANLSSPTYFQGKFYFTNRFDLVFLDLIDSSTPRLVKIISERAVDELVDPLITNKATYLVESEGELLYVQKLYYGLFAMELLGFKIFRADFHENKWVKLKDIGQRAIFLDDAKGVSVSVRRPQEGGGESSGIFKSNCIYFTEPTGRCLHVFDLENETIMPVLPSSEIDKSHDCVRRWVMMSSYS